jgi:hypothetical protein
MLLLILATSVLFIIGLFNPNASLFWYNKQRTKVRSSVVYGVLLILFLYIQGSDSEIRATDNANNLTVAAGPSAVTDSSAMVISSSDNVDDASKKEQELIILKLKLIAQRDWPDDYSTQEYWINQELEAFKDMKLIPDNAIKRRAQRDWPYDFSTQKYWYNQQIEAKERLNSK